MRPVLQVKRTRVMKEFLLRKLIASHRRQSRAADEPKLFCMPEDHIGMSIVTGGLYERDLLHALLDRVLQPWREAFSEATALDVGANIGNHACFLARRFRHVLAFEPSPTFAHLLHANRLVNRALNIDVREVGLGRADATIPFAEYSEGNLGASSFVIDARPGGAVTERPVRRGDDVLRGDPLAHRIMLVKIDVEGYETQVLEGLRETLATHRPFVLFESSGAHGEHGGEAVRTILSQLGYAHMYAVERRRRSASGPFGLIESALAGVDVWIEPIDRLQDRYYALILASTHPVDASRIG